MNMNMRVNIEFNINIRLAIPADGRKPAKARGLDGLGVSLR